MRVTISGQAGIAVVEEPTSTILLSIDDSLTAVRVDRDAAAAWFRGASDVVHVDVVSREDAGATLRAAWRRDRLLQMLLILLRDDAVPELRSEAAEVAEELIESVDARRFARHRLFARPLPNDADITGAIHLARATASSAVEDALEELRDHQHAITALAAHADRFLQRSADPRRLGQMLRTWNDDDGLFYRLATSPSVEAAYRVSAVIAAGSGPHDWREAQTLLAILPDALSLSKGARRSARTRAVDDARDLFLTSLDTIERVIRFVCRRHNLHEADADDFASDVKLALIENDYALIRAFAGRSSLSTYLTTVVRRIFYDRAKAKTAKRATNSTHVLGESTADDVGWRSITASRAAHPRRQVTIAESPSLPEDRHHIAQTSARILGAAIREFTPEEQQILREHFADGVPIRQIALRLHLDPKRVYRTVSALLKRLRKSLEEGGVDHAAIDDLLEHHDVDIRFSFQKAKPSPNDDAPVKDVIVRL